MTYTCALCMHEMSKIITYIYIQSENKELVPYYVLWWLKKCDCALLQRYLCHTAGNGYIHDDPVKNNNMRVHIYPLHMEYINISHALAGMTLLFFSVTKMLYEIWHAYPIFHFKFTVYIRSVQLFFCFHVTIILTHFQTSVIHAHTLKYIK